MIDLVILTGILSAFALGASFGWRLRGTYDSIHAQDGDARRSS